MKKKITPEPKLISEVVMAAFKVFFWIFLVTNIVWAVIYFKPHIQITQSGAHDVVTQNL